MELFLFGLAKSEGATLIVMILIGCAVGAYGGDCAADDDPREWLGGRRMHRFMGAMCGGATAIMLFLLGMFILFIGDNPL